MVIEPIKFFYAADPRLDKPLALGEGGEIFARQGRDAAYEAMRRLVNCALSRKVDFVLLRGELCDSRCGPKAFFFLAEQVRRLADGGILCCIVSPEPSFSERTVSCLRRLVGFSDNVKWFPASLPDDAGVITCKAREVSLARVLEPAPSALQGLSLCESGPHGAWLVSLPDTGVPVREFIELDVLRWERCELDATRIETEEDLAVVWKATKDGFRDQAKRPVLLHLVITGAMKNRALFYGNGLMRDPAALMAKLNTGEEAIENFVLVNSIEDSRRCFAQPSASLPAHGPSKENNALIADFADEADSFKSAVDLRVGVFDALKERGLLKRILASDSAAMPISAAALLDSMTDAGVESILNDACGMAYYGLLKDEVLDE